MTAWKSSMELGDLIATTPGLLSELARFADAPWVQMPRGRRVRLKKAIAAVRATAALQRLEHPTVRVAELAEASAGPGALAEVEGSNPSANDSPEGA